MGRSEEVERDEETNLQEIVLADVVAFMANYELQIGILCLLARNFKFSERQVCLHPLVQYSKLFILNL